MKRNARKYIILFLLIAIVVVKINAGFKFGIPSIVKKIVDKVDEETINDQSDGNQSDGSIWQIIDDDIVEVEKDDNRLMWPRAKTSSGTNDNYTLQWKASNTAGQPIWDSTNNSYNYPAGETATDYPTFKWAEDLVYKGYDDWRLPTKNELRQLYNYGRTYISYDSGHIHYWSSTEVSSELACTVNFSEGAEYYNSKAFSTYVRAVRDSQ